MTILEQLPERPGPAREAMVLDLVRDGQHCPLEWAEVRAEGGGRSVVLYVATDALRLEGVRVAVTHPTAQRIADVLDCVLPTSRIVDLVHTQAVLVVPPAPQTPDARMADTSRVVMHSRAVDARIAAAGGPARGIVSSVGKDWVITNRLVDRPDRAANYGWHTPAGRPIQSVGLAHSIGHTDYSQVMRPVQRRCLVDGAPADLRDVLRSPELAHLVSAEGPLRIVRHPAVPDPDEQPPTLRDPPVPVPAPAPEPAAAAHPFVAARHYTPTSGRAVDLVVLHTMESAEKPGTAMAVARWAAGLSAPRASWHYAVDRDEVVQCVREEDVAWAAPGANHHGIQIEHAGYARQSAAEWDDDYSRRMLERSAALVADICRRHAIPVAHVGVDGLRAGHRGITTHRDVSVAWRRSTHTDPGRWFPMSRYLEMVRRAMAT